MYSDNKQREVVNNHVEKIGSTILIINHDLNDAFLGEFFRDPPTGLGERHSRPVPAQYRQNFNIHLYFTRVTDALRYTQIPKEDGTGYIVKCPLMEFLCKCNERKYHRNVIIHISRNQPDILHTMKQSFTVMPVEIIGQLCDYRIIEERPGVETRYFMSRHWSGINRKKYKKCRVVRMTKSGAEVFILTNSYVRVAVSRDNVSQYQLIHFKPDDVLY